MQGPMMARQIQPDLIILDVMLPAGGGVVVYNRLKQINAPRQTPVILHSSMPKDQVRQSLPEVDSLVFVQKPVELPELLKIIAAKINPSTYITRSSQRAL
jgi:CheY-like chemotaxis protein